MRCPWLLVALGLGQIALDVFASHAGDDPFVTESRKSAHQGHYGPSPMRECWQAHELGDGKVYYASGAVDVFIVERSNGQCTWSSCRATCSAGATQTGTPRCKPRSDLKKCPQFEPERVRSLYDVLTDDDTLEDSDWSQADNEDDAELTSSFSRQGDWCWVHYRSGGKVYITDTVVYIHSTKGDDMCLRCSKPGCGPITRCNKHPAFVCKQIAGSGRSEGIAWTDELMKDNNYY